MKSKLFVLLTLGLGYVLGARAGKERYEQIKKAADKAWNTKLVQGGVDQAQDFVLDRTDEIRRLAGRKIGEMISAPSNKRKTTKRTNKSSSK